MVRRGIVAVLGGVAVVALGMSSAAGARRVSAPLPAPSSFALAPSDFRPGAVVSVQTSKPYTGGRTLFVRAFKPGAELGEQPLLGAVSVAIIDPDESTAALDFVGFKMAANSKSDRQAFAKSWTLEFVKGIAAQSKGKPVLHVKRSQVGAPVTVSESAIRIPLTLTTNMGTIRISLEAVQVDRVVALLELMSWFNRPLDSSDRAAAHSAIEQHLHSAFTVANTTAPTITGTAAQGQTLTADEGVWAGAPSRFSYSWSRCDSTGNNCQAIAGATTKTYQVTTADGGATLTASVIAANSVTSLEATSTPATISS